MKQPIEQREEVVKAFIKDEISKQKAAEILGCTTRTIENYKNAFLADGRGGLVDHRSSNNIKLTDKQKENIIALKQKDRWRSTRNIRDRLNLPVRSATVGKVIRKAGLSIGLRNLFCCTCLLLLVLYLS